MLAVVYNSIETGVIHLRIMKVAVAFFIVVCIAVSHAYRNTGEKKTDINSETAKTQGIKEN